MESFWECEDSFNNVRVETNPGNLMATTIDGYVILEKYINDKELKVKQLERELSRCQREK